MPPAARRVTEKMGKIADSRRCRGQTQSPRSARHNSHLALDGEEGGKVPQFCSYSNVHGPIRRYVVAALKYPSGADTETEASKWGDFVIGAENAPSNVTPRQLELYR